MPNHSTDKTNHKTTEQPSMVNLSYQTIQQQLKKNPTFIALSGASVVWLNTLMITFSIGLMIYAGFTQELFFANERNSEFVFTVTMCIVLALWYVNVFNQLFKRRKIEFFANQQGAYILANRSRHDYFFLPWERVSTHVVARGYYNGSAAAITLHTTFSAVPDAVIERGSSHALLENGQALFSIIPNSFIRYEVMEQKLDNLLQSKQTETTASY